MSTDTAEIPQRRAPRSVALSKAERTRRAILDLVLGSRPMTADELADRLDLSILYVRPRVSELVTRGDLASSGQRGRNASGKRATKWMVVNL
jgi:predicted ArsR family transcriptional regulator